jgi:TP901 family phage tail tape measure protein
MAIPGGEIISYLTLDTSQYFNNFERAMAAANSAGGMMQQAGKAAAAGITLPIVGAATAASKSAIDFESAFAGVKKTIDATESVYDGLRQSILGLSGEIPLTASELAKIMELGGQLNVPIENLSLFTKTMAGLAASTDLSAEAASTMLAQYMNVMRMDYGDIEKLGSVIVDLGNNTATTESAIVYMAQRLAGAGRIVGLTSYEVMALSATMAGLGINAEAGGSSMSFIMQNMLKYTKDGGKELEVLAETAGMSKKQFADLFGEKPVKALGEFISGLNNIQQSGGNIYDTLSKLKFNNIRVLQTITGLLGGAGQLEENTERAKKAWESNTALAEETGKRYETTASQIQIAKNKIKEAAIEIGDTLLPTISDIAEKAGDAADSFTKLSDEEKANIVHIAGIAALAGPATWAVGKLVGALTGPAGLVAAIGLTGAALALLEKEHKDNVFKRMDESMGSIKLSAEDIQKIIEEGFGKPAIDFTGLDEARKTADGALESLQELQNTLANDVYLVNLGVKTPEEADLQAQCGQIVKSANEYLALSENAAKMTVTAYFGDDTGNGMVGDIESAMEPMKEQLAAKGKELGDALKGAIADGEIDAEERQVIANLQKEINYITTQDALLKSQAEKDVLIANAQYQGLSMESIEKLVAGADKYEKSLKEDYAQERDSVITIASNLKNLGVISDREYDFRIDEIMERYGSLEADAALGKQDTLWEAFGKQISEFVTQKTTRARELNKAGISLSLDYGEPEEIAKQDEMRAIQQEAIQMGLVLVPLEQSFRESYNKLIESGREVPAYMQEIIRFFNELDNLSVMSDEWFTNEDFKMPDTDIVNKGMENRIKEDKKRIKDLSDDLNTKTEEGMDAAVDAVENKQDEVKGAAENAFNTLPESAENVKQPTENAVKNTMASAVSSTRNGATSMVSAGRSGLSPMPGVFINIGNMAVSGLAGALRSGTGEIASAASALGKTVENSIKGELKIASPSKVMIGIGANVVGSLVGTIKANLPKIKEAGQKIGENIRTSIQSGSAQTTGYTNTIIDGRLKRSNDTALSEREKLLARMQKAVESGTRIAGGGLPKMDKKTRELADKLLADKKGGGSGRRASTVIGDFQYNQNDFDYLRDGIKKLEDERERLLRLTGNYRPYYDKTNQEKEIEAVEEKYEKLIEKEKECFERLSDEQQSSARKSFEKRLDELNKMQNEEIDMINGNYELQKKLGQDFLTSQKERLRYELDLKKEQYRQDDWEEEIKDLEKQARQTRSARKRRELNEKIDKMRRDEALRQEEAALDETFKGIDALYEALDKGVIGLGDIISAPDLPESAFGAGIESVQGVNLPQLEKALAAVEEVNRRQSSGNTYNIDLKGAVIRDESDIERLAEAFERRMRSIERDYRHV